ncbi:MAG: DUF4294 domain-containing protein [Flavobacteriaceae bacterium TMED42]|nr:MAG: DUF4294 domain-containing protein [Flavobacteriaceae bacterium TMED42]|tara:strand:+ start:4115 stop:4816 length:702 start_codon:yes stop_codon:yes gene_type:complete
MKPHALMTVILVMACFNLLAQKSPPLPEDYFVIEGDTIINSSIQLEEVVLFQPLKFYNYDEAKKYVILRERTYKVYPYAKIAADRLNVFTRRLEQIKSKRKRRVYLMRMEDFVYDEFEKELKKLSRSQGRILIKLVNRQTGETTHELVKELRNGWRAFVYQTTASLFKLSLKDTYDPETIYEDYLIEDILQRAFSVDRLERQDTALDYDLDSLYQYWKENKPKFTPPKKTSSR